MGEQPVEPRQRRHASDNREEILRARHALELLASAVRGTVVDDDDFLLDRRGVDGPQKFIHVRNLVVDGDDDGHASRPPLLCW